MFALKKITINYLLLNEVAMKDVCFAMKKHENKRYEVDLYHNRLKIILSKKALRGYGEVNHCDVAAVKENELVIVELKLSLTIDC